jgi:hypothetical protein
MIQKPGNIKNSILTNILLSLIGLYVVLILLQFLSPLQNIEQAIVINSLMILIAVLVIIFTIVFIAKNKRAWPVILIMPFILFIGSLFAPLTSPYSKYPLYVMKCGGQPITATNFAAAYDYSLPGDRTYRVGIFTQYFCSEQEAQAAGFNRKGSPQLLKPQSQFR